MDRMDEMCERTYMDAPQSVVRLASNQEEADAAERSKQAPRTQAIYKGESRP